MKHPSIIDFSQSSGQDINAHLQRQTRPAHFRMRATGLLPLSDRVELRCRAMFHGEQELFPVCLRSSKPSSSMQQVTWTEPWDVHISENTMICVEVWPEDAGERSSETESLVLASFVWNSADFLCEDAGRIDSCSGDITLQQGPGRQAGSPPLILAVEWTRLPCQEHPAFNFLEAAAHGDAPAMTELLLTLKQGNLIGALSFVEEVKTCLTKTLARTYKGHPYLLILPLGLLHLILIHLSDDDIRILRRVCRKAWKSIAKDNVLWKDRFEARFPEIKCEPYQGKVEDLDLSHQPNIIHQRSPITTWFELYMNTAILNHVKSLVTAGSIAGLSVFKGTPYLNRPAPADLFPPLHHAINGRKAKVAKFLIREMGVDLELCDWRLERALHRAAWTGQCEILTILIEEQKVEKSPTNMFKYTPLHLACANGQKLAAEYLIDQGLDVNAKSNKHYTPLHRAKLKGHPEVVELLLGRGADATAKTVDGKTVDDFKGVVRRNHPAFRYGRRP